MANGLVLIGIQDPVTRKQEETLYSSSMACPDCGINVPKLEPRSFSFNSTYGACPECHGLGSIYDFDPAKTITDWSKPLLDGAMGPGSASQYLLRLIKLAAEKYKINLNQPFEQLTHEQQNLFLYGPPKGEASRTGFHGIFAYLRANLDETKSEGYREYMMQYMSATTCPRCHGKRLRPESSPSPSTDNASPTSPRSRSNARSPARRRCTSPDASASSPTACSARSSSASNSSTPSASAISRSTAPPPRSPAAKASAFGSPRRSARASAASSTCSTSPRSACTSATTSASSRRSKICATSATPCSSSSTMKTPSARPTTFSTSAPAPARTAATSSPTALRSRSWTTPASVTGQYLAGKIEIVARTEPRPLTGNWITVENARAHNLQNVTAHFPLGVMTVVTGVSGSGKSTLVNDILYRALAKELYGSREEPGQHGRVRGISQIDKVIEIDQSPIGRTPRSNPATYTGVFTAIRDLFAMLPESRERGYKPGRFSFNVQGGRCEACQGEGQRRIEMNFLPDVYVLCEVCNGRRYNQETLAVKFNGYSIADLLDLAIEDALPILKDIPTVNAKLQTLVDVGLGYIHLGQSATTLSGGEAQRMKLARELSKRQTGRTLYLLDEPTTGLHFDDVRKLLEVLHRLTDLGNTVIIIEHNLDIIRNADYILDLGPEGGEGGGQIIAHGTPEQVATVKGSHTAEFLARHYTPAQLAAARNGTGLEWPRRPSARQHRRRRRPGQESEG